MPRPAHQVYTPQHMMQNEYDTILQEYKTYKIHKTRLIKTFKVSATLKHAKLVEQVEAVGFASNSRALHCHSLDLRRGSGL